MSALAYAALVAALWTADDGSAGAAAEPRFAVKQTRIAIQPATQPGHRFAVAGTVQTRTATDRTGRFVVKGGVEPGECGITVLFLNGFEN